MQRLSTTTHTNNISNQGERRAEVWPSRSILRFTEHSNNKTRAVTSISLNSSDCPHVSKSSRAWDQNLSSWSWSDPLWLLRNLFNVRTKVSVSSPLCPQHQWGKGHDSLTELNLGRDEEEWGNGKLGDGDRTKDWSSAGFWWATLGILRSEGCGAQGCLRGKPIPFVRSGDWGLWGTYPVEELWPGLDCPTSYWMVGQAGGVWWPSLLPFRVLTWEQGMMNGGLNVVPVAPG